MADSSGERRAASGDWEPVIGLEIHVQLPTRTKMFCGCELSFGDEPERPHLPDLPRPPGDAAGAERAGDPATRSRSRLALGCEIAPRSIFHRKNYFYPDNPKAYQISQYDFPLAVERAPRRRPHPSRPPGGGRGEARPRLGDPGASTAPAARWSTSTAAARRWSRSSPSPTCTTRRPRASGCSCCARRSARSAPRT